MSFPFLWWPVASAFCKHCATAREAAAHAVSSWLRHQLLYLVPLPPVTESLHLLVYMASEPSVSNIVNSNRKRCAGVKLRKVCGAAQPAMRPTQGYFTFGLCNTAILVPAGNNLHFPIKSGKSLLAVHWHHTFAITRIPRCFHCATMFIFNCPISQWRTVASAFCKHCATAIEAAARAVSSWQT